MGIYAMEHGKHAAIEVPAAMSLDEIWHLSILPKRPVNTVCNLKTVFMTSSN